MKMMPRGCYRYPPARVPEAPIPGVTGGVHPGVQYDMGGLPVWDAARSPPVGISQLATMLANSSPDQPRLLLGESLYPLVEQLEPEMAAKVTGMLLEMDQTEFLHLLESPDALKSKVSEVMDVLRNVAQQQQPSNPAEQLAALSLNDNLS